LSERRGDWPLAQREALPEDFVWLRDAFPRSRSGEAAVPQTATHWLAMHDGFRRVDHDMAQLSDAYRCGQLDLRGFHDRLLPALAQFLQHLDGHHTIESQHYFPRFRRLEPRIVAGLDLLDRDHDQIHLALQALSEAGNALHRDFHASSSDASDRAEQLADILTSARPALARHLDDEEDIVIPLLALR
jgi:iron-sulfur cluster repair protein YtfE (RIC family)